MGDIGQAYFRSELETRRQRLEAAASSYGRMGEVERLIREVDAALARMDNGTYGLCEECHEPVEMNRLLADPLVCMCLDHLNPEERRTLERDLELAVRVQSSLLPTCNVNTHGWETCYHYEAAGPVGGDYCDIVRTGNGDGGLFFLVGDVSGKGVAASLLMSHLHAIFRTLLAAPLAVEELMDRANRVFAQSTMSSSYATLACGRGLGSGDLEIANAGHAPPILIRNGEIWTIKPTGLPLGLFGHGHYAAERYRLNPGDSLLLFTDGFTEARNTAGEEYGLEGLMEAARRNARLRVEAMAKACLDDFNAFLNGAPRHDDLTLLVVRRAA